MLTREVDELRKAQDQKMHTIASQLVLHNIQDFSHIQPSSYHGVELVTTIFEQTIQNLITFTDLKQTQCIIQLSLHIHNYIWFLHIFPEAIQRGLILDVLDIADDLIQHAAVDVHTQNATRYDI
jgi:hypothetical protein